MKTQTTLSKATSPLLNTQLLYYFHKPEKAPKQEVRHAMNCMGKGKEKPFSTSMKGPARLTWVAYEWGSYLLLCFYAY